MITEADLKPTGEKLASFTMGSLGADVRSSTGVATVPSWDNIDTDDAKASPLQMAPAEFRQGLPGGLAVMC